MKALIQLLAGRPPEPPLDEAGWRALLELADRTLCTTLLHGSPHIPEWFARETEARVQKNVLRRQRLLNACAGITAALERASLEFVLLKGFTHDGGFGVDPALRASTDLDFWLRPQDLPAAREALLAIGYTPHQGGELSEDHAVPLLQPAGWTWSGDYYDPAFPAVVELHHSLWNSARDRIAAPGLEDFWTRRVWMDVGGFRAPALEEMDRLAFAALHLLRHILRNDARPAHACELACVLRARTSGWEAWPHRYTGPLRRLQAIAFRFVAEWFGCPLPEPLRDEWSAMPARIREWFRAYAWSPLRNLTVPNKDVLWLHLALLPRLADRAAVARARLLPLRLRRRGEAWRRLRYHAVALARAIATAARQISS
jgi:hypothetical protein